MDRNTRSALVAALILTLCTATLVTSLFVITSSKIHQAHYVTKVYLGSFTEEEYLPLLVLYDPYGDDSYQKNLITTNASFTLQMEGKGQTEVSGSIKTGIQSISVSSSDSENTSDVGPGKGDCIFGYAYDLKWDVYKYHDFDPNANLTRDYLHLELASSNIYGTFALSRKDFVATTDTYVENKTREPANYTQYECISATATKLLYFNYTWSGTVKTGYSFNVTVSVTGQPVTYVLVTYSIVCSTPQTIPCLAYFHESSHDLTFYEAADSADASLGNVFSYTLWFNPS